MNLHGMIIEGYAVNMNSGLATCGLGTINRFSESTVKQGEEEQALKDIFSKIRWSNPKPHGTVVFSLSSMSIHSRASYPFVKYICEHPNTKCMHYYTNDAHGPNMVFLCVHHLNPEATKPKRLRQLMQVFEKTEFVNGIWRMKDA